MRVATNNFQRNELVSTSVDETQFASLSPPVWRASTVVFRSLKDFVERKNRLPDGFTYGTTGTPTQRKLETRIAALDGAAHCIVTPSGQAAICLALIANLKAGDHLLMVESAYGPAKTFALQYLVELGVQVELYDPYVGAGISKLFKSNTRMVWMESPGSMTMEIQDVPAIVGAATQHSILTGIDNTWSTAINFKPFDFGVGLTVQACTKYMGGHSDVLMGCITTNDSDLYKRLRQLQALMGQAVSAEDCFLISRGLDTLHLRICHQATSALKIANYLKHHPMVKAVLHPSLAESPDYRIWCRDFNGAGSVFSLALIPAHYDAFSALFGSFKHFAIGASWGGVHSVAAFFSTEELTTRSFKMFDGPLIRISVGLEDVNELIADLHEGLKNFAGTHQTQTT